MVITNGYTDVPTLKARLSITGTGQDAILEQVIEAASRLIDGLTGDGFFAVSAQTRILHAEAIDFLAVPSLRAVTALATDEDGDRVYETTWAATDYDLEPVAAAYENRPFTSIQVAPNGTKAFPRRRRGVQITGDWGWAVPPDAIVEACLILATRFRKRVDAPYGLAGSDQLGQAQMVLPSIDPDVRQLLAPYRRFFVGAV